MGDLSVQIEQAELLHVAVVRNNFELVRDLLETYHLDPNAKSIQGLSPLHLASWEGSVAVVVCLLLHGANVGLAEERMGWTALHFAARRGHEEVFAALMESGANPLARDAFGCTALPYAVLGGSLTIVDFLLQHGLEPNMRSSLSFEASCFCPSSAEPSPAHLADELAIVSCATPLHLASAEGNLELVHLLLEYKANVNLRDDAGRTPLGYAVRQLQVDVVQALLSRGSKVNASDCMGTTALHIAVGMALREPEEERRALAWSVAELLLKHGANVEAKDKREQSPLDVASAERPAQEKLVALAWQHRKRTANSVICLSVIGLATSFVMLSRWRG